MKISILLQLLMLSALLSCTGGNPSKNRVSLVRTDKKLSFPLDSETKSALWAMFPYTDSNGKEYLTFQNERRNDLLFYDMNSGELLYRIKPEREGADGVGRFFGYYIQDLDTIYLTSFTRALLTKIDGGGRVLERIKYDTASEGVLLGGANSISHVYMPIISIGNNLYIISKCNRQLDKNPVSAVIDMDTKEIHALPFEYPIFPVSDNKLKTFSIEMDFSRCYDGKNFIYSFHYDKDIYVASPDHRSVRKIPVDSKYVPKIKFTELMTSGDPMKDLCENPMYGNLYYDNYRHVYYRLAYPEDELPFKENYKDLYAYGRRKFSIIILDKDFNIIGETLFPEYIYNPTAMFVREDGVYISDSHFKNPAYDEDRLSFVRFELVDQDKKARSADEK